MSDARKGFISWPEINAMKGILPSSYPEDVPEDDVPKDVPKDDVSDLKELSRSVRPSGFVDNLFIV